ncbi:MULTISPECIES: hypothetical protein [Mycobacterium]|uniref:Transposase n=3 Tax=Mycobacterium TaxID=1763 RepID=A0AAW5SAE2_MYCBC|nr:MULTISPECIES: hypothetical protein [Mycobacterium]MBZ4504977.1 transposase [Mycobacterium avium subsp. hominissuis]MBZ4518139.1 transposase [Mycobacterium avium subsp. hominissuis]MBZ4527921.1 transposase [Mycobacterium avium subsp. hominissuis]MBZ4547222.1 transposase [Mycobacterium avium subsp. hominissuis]MBZ4556899.1 transposase [Mycobacterium avium subsp. hominissuis]
MTVSQASLDALARHTQMRRDSVNSRVLKALKDLRREKAPISISSVARRADVTRKSIYHRPTLLALIETHRTVTVVPDEPAPAAAGPESSIVAALRLRLTAKDAQIAELKAALRERDQTIAVLHGEIDKLHAGS